MLSIKLFGNVSLLVHVANFFFHSKTIFLCFPLKRIYLSFLFYLSIEAETVQTKKGERKTKRKWQSSKCVSFLWVFVICSVMYLFVGLDFDLMTRVYTHACSADLWFYAFFNEWKWPLNRMGDGQSSVWLLRNIGENPKGNSWF